MSAPVVEYIVHGYFHGYLYRHQRHARGVVAAWWVPLRKLVKQLGQKYVEEKLQAFEVDALSYKNTPAPAAVEAEWGLYIVDIVDIHSVDIVDMCDITACGVMTPPEVIFLLIKQLVAMRPGVPTDRPFLSSSRRPTRLG